LSIRLTRRLFQAAFVVAAAWTGVAAATGRSLGSVEAWCPFGGLETLHSVLVRQRFSCAAGELNLALFVALVLLTLLARKSFCAWVCPVGTIGEWLAGLGRLLRRKRLPPPPGTCGLGLVDPPARFDRPARVLRLLVLAAVLYFTWRAGELVFRPYDPYYVLFSAGGHDVESWSYVLVGVLLAAAVVVPMAWCRYLCPLGGVIWPLARAGRLRLRRDPATCTGCGACDRACPHSLRVSRTEELRSGECTLCLECTSACPTVGALTLRAGGRP
jgi:polyferredoxin